MIGTLPPSALQAAPVTYDARSEQRKTMTAAISSGRASRPIGMVATIWSRISFLIAFTMSVSTYPGDTVLTVTPLRTTSWASALAKPAMPAFAAEIERELRMLEEYVLDEDVSDDLGESLMARDDDFEPPEVPFQPKPTSVSIAALESGTHGGGTRSSINDFSSDSNFTTMPKVDREDIHGAKTQILDNKGRNAARAPDEVPTPPRRPGRQARTQPPPPPPPRKAQIRPAFDEDLHAAPTMIIDIGRMRQRRR